MSEIPQQPKPDLLACYRCEGTGWERPHRLGCFRCHGYGWLLTPHLEDTSVEETVSHTLRLSDTELVDLYDLLKHTDTQDRPGAQSVWERLFDLWSVNRERINAALRENERS